MRARAYATSGGVRATRPDAIANTDAVANRTPRREVGRKGACDENLENPSAGPAGGRG
jgi:hypothetical protein